MSDQDERSLCEMASGGIRVVAAPIVADTKTSANLPTTFSPPTSRRGLGRGRGARIRGIESPDRNDAKPGSLEPTPINPRRSARDTGARRVGLDELEDAFCLTDDDARAFGSNEAGNLSVLTPAELVLIHNSDVEYESNVDTDNCEEDQYGVSTQLFETGVGGSRTSVSDRLGVSSKIYSQYERESNVHKRSGREVRMSLPSGRSRAEVKSQSSFTDARKADSLRSDLLSVSDEKNKNLGTSGKVRTELNERSRESSYDRGGRGRKLSSVSINVQPSSSPVGCRNSSRKSKHRDISYPGKYAMSPHIRYHDEEVVAYPQTWNRQNGRQFREMGYDRKFHWPPSDGDCSRSGIRYQSEMAVQSSSSSDEEYRSDGRAGYMVRRRSKADCHARPQRRVTRRNGSNNDMDERTFINHRSANQSSESEDYTYMRAAQAQLPRKSSILSDCQRGRFRRSRPVLNQVSDNVTRGSDRLGTSLSYEDIETGYDSYKLRSSWDDYDDEWHGRRTKLVSSKTREDEKSRATRSRRMKSDLKPARYDGTTSIDTFLIQFETCADYNKWTDEEKAAQLKCCLSGAVGQILWEAGDPGRLSYKELVRKLKARYGATGQKELFVAQLRSRRRRPNETLAELYRDIKRLMALAYPNTSGTELHEEIAKSQFISALDDRTFQLKLLEKETKDLDGLFTTAVRLEAYRNAYQEGDPREIKPSRGKYGDGLANRVAAIEQKINGDDAIDARCEELRRLLEKERAERDRVSRELDKLRLLDEHRRIQVNGETKISRDQQMIGKESGRSEYPERVSKRVKCYRCQGIGHYARECRNTRPKTVDFQQTNDIPVPIRVPETTITDVQAAPGQVCGAESGITAREAFLRLKILGRRTDCLLDTGSEVTLIPAKLVGTLPVEPSSQKLLAANGTTINVIGQLSLEAEGGRHKFTITGYVSDQVVEVILGIDFLRSHKAVWSFEKAEVILNGYKHKLCPKKPPRWVRRVVAADQVIVPGRSECLIPSYVVFNGSPKKAEDSVDGWITERVGLLAGLHVSRVLIPDRNIDIPVRVLNMDKAEVIVSSGTVLADLQPAINTGEQSELSELLVTQARSQMIQELIDRVDIEVSTSIRSDLKVLLENYSSVFSTSEMDLGRTNIVQHEIDTGSARPVRQPLRRHPPAHQAAIRDHVSSMLKQGVIEPAQSPWASNVVLVKKKDGTLRCCVDYRQLNNLTRKDAYPLPRTDACFDAMSGAQWFSTFDLRSSYHQVEVRPEDADKTAFICREGLFRFVTMPFGLCGAPATFQRLMDMIMLGLNFEICLVYLDDIIVFSDTVEKHLERLVLVLDRIQSSGLKIKASKTHLLQRSVNFLGHVISYRGIEPQEEKVSAVVNWPQPETVKNVKAFLGLCGYYRRFIEGFAEIAAPLYDLLRKERRFEWTKYCDESFEKLKSTLTSAPILGIPNDDDPFVLDTDASNEAIGAVLSQMQNNKEIVIAFASRRLSEAERNYCITRRELLAVVYFVKYFRHYILGRQFTVRTDHAALKWLKKVPEPIGQQARWLEQLEEYNFVILHRAGTRHGNADAMSRRPCDKPRCCKLPKNTIRDKASMTLDYVGNCFTITTDDTPNTNEWLANNLADAQEKDCDIGPIMNYMKESLEKPSWDNVAPLSEAAKSLWHQWERLKLFRGVLVRRFETVDGRLECLQTVLPSCRRLEFIRLVHEGPTGGHLGRRRTERQVQLRAYWPGWTIDVRKALQMCVPCAKYHRGKAPKQTPLKPFVSGEPWEVVSVDITGPHPRSRRGYVFILTLVDHFTKWAEALPIRNHTAVTVARALFDHIFSRFGMPVRCLTDQGAEFESTLFTQLCHLMGIHKIRTTPYRPSTNATVERFHRTLNSMLAKVVSQNQRDWCEHLSGVMTAYRASLHETTHFSPNRLMFGRENRLPADIVLCGNSESPHPTKLDDFVEEMETRQKADFALVRQHLGQAARRRKQRYDDAVNERTFKPGQLVWYFYPRKRQGLSPKWQSFYVGPYRVLRLIDTHNVVIQRSNRSKCIVVHRDKLKACVTSSLEDLTCQSTSPAVLRKYNAVDKQEVNNDEIEEHFEEAGKILSGAGTSPFPENSLVRPKRVAKLPRHLTDFVVYSVFRSQMTSQMVHLARNKGLVCDACSKAFAQRHGLKYHLEAKVNDPSHANYARQELQNWRSRGQYRFSERRSASSWSDYRVSNTRHERQSDFPKNRRASQNESWNSPGGHQQEAYVPRVRSIVQAVPSSAVAHDRRFVFHRRPFRCWSGAVKRHRASTRSHVVSTNDTSYGPARTLYISAMRLARQMLHDPTNVDPDKAISLTRRICPRMSAGQARVAAASVFAGIQVSLRAIFPHSGSVPISSNVANQWLHAADNTCDRMKIKTIEEEGIGCEGSERLKVGEDELIDEPASVSVDFGDNEPLSELISQEQQVKSTDIVTVLQEQVISEVRKPVQVGSSPHLYLIQTAETPGSESVTEPSTDTGISSETTLSADETTECAPFLSDIGASILGESTVSAADGIQTISVESSPLKTRSLTDACSRSDTPPFRSAADGKVSSVVHVHGRCLHVEMPVPVERSPDDVEPELDGRINRILNDPTSDLFWAVRTTSPEASKKVVAPQQTLQQRKNSAMQDEGPGFAESSKAKVNSALKRIGTHDGMEPPKKIPAVDKPKPTDPISSHVHSAKPSSGSQKKQAAVLNSKIPTAKSTVPSGASKERKTTTPDNSSFARAITLNSVTPSKGPKKTSKVSTCRKEEEIAKNLDTERKKVKESCLVEGRDNCQITKTSSAKPVKSAPRVTTAEKPQTGKDNRHSTESQCPTAATNSIKKNKKKKSSNEEAAVIQDSCSTALASQSCQKATHADQSLTSADNSTSSMVSAPTTTGQSGFMDPFAWACMFGAMAAGMNFFPGQAPRWPSELGAQLNTSSGQASVPSSQVSPFAAMFPGFNFPWPRGPAS